MSTTYLKFRVPVSSEKTVSYFISTKDVYEYLWHNKGPRLYSDNGITLVKNTYCASRQRFIAANRPYLIKNYPELYI